MVDKNIVDIKRNRIIWQLVLNYMKNAKEHKKATLYLRVLGYQDTDGSWTAHCLETDLVGYGDTFELALGNLKELLQMQVSFALYKNQPALLDRPAPIEIFETYNSLLRLCLQRIVHCDKLDPKRRITSIPWPEKISKPDFAVAEV